MCISWTIKGLISLMHGVTMKKNYVYFTSKPVHKHNVIKVLHSLDCYLNMTLYNTATITYSTAHIMFTEVEFQNKHFCVLHHITFMSSKCLKMISPKKSGSMETYDKLPNVRLLWVPIYGLYCVRVDIYIFFLLFRCAFEFRDWLTELVG